MESEGKVIYIAKPGEWFDEGTVVELIDDYRLDKVCPMNSGLFCGYRDGQIDEEICPFDEFEEICEERNETEV